MNGVIVIDKDEKMTSFDVVAKMRKICGTKKVGHTGTLDPDATGVLPVCIGSATRAADIMTGADNKRYQAVLRLGSATDTYDASGKITDEAPWANVTDSQIEEAAKKFTGNILQVPPMYSAIKQGGKKLYQLAREGKTVELEPREIRVNFINILSRDGADIVMDISCSKGTYIRSICHDMGISLGCFGHMAKLRRTESGAFNIDRAVKLSELTPETAERFLIPTSEVFDYPVFHASEKQAFLVKNGVSAYCEGEKGIYRVFAPDGEFLSVSEITEIEGTLCLKLIKSFWS